MKWSAQFAFAPEEAGAGVIRIESQDAYDMERGYGYAQSPEPSRNEDMRDSWPGEYFIPHVPTFLVDVPYGNYKVTVTVGRPEAPSATTIKAGQGHLVLDTFETAPGETIRETFAVHVEDGQLKLAFAGAAPGVRKIEIERSPDVPTLFLAGDSTVTDQASGQYPYTGWGQMIGKCFTAGLAVCNHARSGRSSKSFIDESRLTKLWRRVRPADYILVQFAHNDEKDNDGGTLPYTTYQQYLKRYIDGARERGAHPVLVAPMHRRFFDEQGQIKNTHGEYIEAMRQLADREQVPFLDLASKSKELFEKLGAEETKRIFMWAEPGRYASMPEGAQDNTHFSEEGGIAIARLVAECIREAGVEPLASYLR
jgi:lysophospholipase L1-like esterase